MARRMQLLCRDHAVTFVQPVTWDHCHVYQPPRRGGFACRYLSVRHHPRFLVELPFDNL